MENRKRNLTTLLLTLLCVCLLTFGLKACDNSVRLPSMGSGIHSPASGDVVSSKAKEVDNLISGIATPITLESAGAIGAARAAYDALSDSDKAQVSLLDKLKGYEADLAKLQAEAEGAKEGTGAYLDELLAGISTPVTAKDYDLLAKIRADYNALPDAEKANFKGLDKLNGYELDLFSNPANLDELLDGINSANPANANLLAKIRAAYDNLSDADKANFKGLDKLNGFEADLYSTGAGLDIVLDQIKTPITLDDADLINRLRAAYNDLPEAEKANFKGLDKLSGYELDLSNLGLPNSGDANDANAVIDLINGIKTPITLDSEDAINNALKAYNSLSDSAKSNVSNYNLLQDYLNQLNNLKGPAADVPATGVE